MGDKYSRFPSKATDEDIFEMIITGNAKATCCECSLINDFEYNPDIETFICKKCNTKQFVPFYNEDELKKNIEQPPCDTSLLEQLIEIDKVLDNE